MEHIFYQSGFNRTLCGSKWDPVNGLGGNYSAFKYQLYKVQGVDERTINARYGCCLSGQFMSSPFLNESSFNINNSCTSCPINTFANVSNDDTSCQKCEAGKVSPAIGSTKCQDLCPPTNVLHSDKAATNSIFGIIDQSFNVTCNPGWSGSGKTVCDSSLRWSPVRTCVANTCSCPNGKATLFNGTGATLCDNSTVDCSECDQGYTISAAPASKSSQICNANTCTATQVLNSSRSATNSINGTSFLLYVMSILFCIGKKYSNILTFML